MEVSLGTEALLTQSQTEPKEMLSVGVTPDGREYFKINFSSLSIMQECWRKVDYSLNRKLRSNLESPATLFGSAIHKALETYYRGKRTERQVPKHYRETMEMISCGRWESDWEESLLFRSARSFVEKAEPLSQLPDDNKRSLHTGVWMLQHYFEKYLTDEYVVCEDEQGPIVERKFTMRVWEDERVVIDLFGTIDAVMRNEVNGLVLGCDHKTTSQLYDFYSMVSPNHQYTAYTWAINRVLGIETDSFLVNALQVKPAPKTARGSPPDFARQVTLRTQDDFDELLLSILGFVGGYSHFSKIKQWPMSSPGPCQKYGGCQYHEICSAPRSLRESVIRSRYLDAP